MNERDDLFLKLLKYLKKVHVDDPDIDLWIAVVTNDLVGIKKVLPGANPNITDMHLIEKYRIYLTNEDIEGVFTRWLFTVFENKPEFNA